MAAVGEALVAVTAAPTTPPNLLCASGTSPFGEPATTYGPGLPAARTRGGDGFVPLSADPACRDTGSADAGRGGGVDVVLDPLRRVPLLARGAPSGPGERLVNLGSVVGPTATHSSAHLRSGSREVRNYTHNEPDPQRTGVGRGRLETHAAAGRLTVGFENLPLDDPTTSARARRAASSPGGPYRRFGRSKRQ